MSPPVCAICSTPLRLTAACRAVHEEHCHDCYRLSLAGGTPERHAQSGSGEWGMGSGGSESPPPIPYSPFPTPLLDAPLVLSPRDVQALVRYRLHREAVLGTGALADLVTEEGTGGSGEWAVGSGEWGENSAPYSLLPTPYSLSPEDDPHA